MSHTPGSWENDGNDIWAGDYKIGTVSGVKDQNGLFTNPSRVLADSALIAAAPELLDACRHLLASLTDWCETADAEDEREDDYQAIALAKAAIAKAEGKVPENT